ncbi:MAG TPA: CHAT domain-containing protein [Chitinophagales bacterium]|nr:CHAT domain-containing protein [Chitinophagales bacterium]HQW79501.1 CHAT domain-containing protein [Chitinophagales bacterium]
MLTILSICTFAGKEQSSRLLTVHEQTVPALKAFTQELNVAVKTKNQFEAANKIYWISECLFQLRELDALNAVLKYCTPFVQKNNEHAYVKLQIIYGKYLIEKANYKSCILVLNELLTITLDKNLQSEIYLSLADVYQRQQQSDSSIACYRFILKNTSDTIQLAKAYNGIGSYYCLVSKLDSAKIMYETAISFLTKTVGNNHSLYAQVCYNLGLVADRNSDYYMSELYFQRALFIYISKAGERHPMTANSYGVLASLYILEDNPDKALHYALKEYNILLQLYGSEHPDLIYSFLNLGKIYFLLDDVQKAERYFRDALKLSENKFGRNHSYYKQSVVEISKILASQDRLIEASVLLENSKSLKYDEYLGDIYLQSGENNLAKQSYAAALKDFTKAHEIFSSFYGEKNIYSLQAMLGLSNMYLESNQLQLALNKAEYALTMTYKDKQKTHVYDNWVCMMQLLKCKKELYKSSPPSIKMVLQEVNNIRATIEQANLVRHTLYSAGSQAYFTERMSVLNQLGIYFLTHWYPKRDAYFYNQLLFFAENDKANLLRQKIINYQSQELLPESEQNKASFITGKLNYFDALKQKENNNVKSVDDSIFYYSTLFEEFTTHIELKYPKIYYLKYGKNNINTTQIQRQLVSDATFLEYFNDDENYYCLVIQQSKISIQNCGNLKYIDSLIVAFQQSIILQKYNINLANILSKLLLPDEIQKNLVIAATKSISLLDFDVLQRNNQYLIQHHTSQFAFSANTYFLHRSTIQQSNVLAIFPNYKSSSFVELNTQKEQTALKQFSDVAFFMYPNFSKLNKSIISAGIVHIGAHLVIDTIHPLQSSIVLFPEHKNQLSIDEIWKLNLNTQLVTLAACQSNFGKSQIGEGVRNFAWAFHYAGARNILSTQWNAPDKATSTIIANFYTNLNAGQNKSEALRLAKLKYLETTDNIGAQPYFWSNFKLFGDASEIDVAPHFLLKYWCLPVLFSILIYWVFSLINKYYVLRRYRQ